MNTMQIASITLRINAVHSTVAEVSSGSSCTWVIKELKSDRYTDLIKQLIEIPNMDVQVC